MKAVVAHELNNFSVVDVKLDKPKFDEVLVKMKATGVCHSDLSVINGTLPLPAPIILGHEGAGSIAEVGEGVTDLAVGDKVVLAKGVVEEEAAGLPRRLAEARCCCRRRWSGVIT